MQRRRFRHAIAKTLGAVGVDWPKLLRAALLVFVGFILLAVFRGLGVVQDEMWVVILLVLVPGALYASLSFVYYLGQASVMFAEEASPLAPPWGYEDHLARTLNLSVWVGFFSWTFRFALLNRITEDLEGPPPEGLKDCKRRATRLRRFAWVARMAVWRASQDSSRHVEGVRAILSMSSGRRYTPRDRSEAQSRRVQALSDREHLAALLSEARHRADMNLQKNYTMALHRAIHAMESAAEVHRRMIEAADLVLSSPTENPNDIRG